VAGSGWGFNQGEMQQAVNGFEECASGARQTMSLLESELQSAIQGQLAGLHKDALDRLHVRIQEDMQTINKALDEMSNRVAQTKQKYNVNDSDASALYGKLLGQVG
jgi:uncharacterized protein YukE